jgi:hypothetical protein
MTAITSRRTTIPAWRVARAAWFRNRLTMTGVLAVFAAAAGWTVYQAASMRSWLVAHQVLGCTTSYSGSRCESSTAWSMFSGYLHPYQVVYVLLGVPAVTATFGGVRWLTREFETGSFRYTWVQGVSRLRWLTGTAAPLLAVTIIGAVACGLAFDRWFPMGQWLVSGTPDGEPWEWNGFPLTPVTFTALVLAGLGVATLAAALVRRTVPAMAATLAVSAVIVYLADTRLRLWLFTLRPVTTRAEYDRWPVPGYLLRGWLTDAAGHVIPGFYVTHDGGLMLPSSQLGTVLTNGSIASERAWLAAHHYTYWMSYQPQDRFLFFQLVWAGAMLVIGVASFGIAVRCARAFS